MNYQIDSTKNIIFETVENHDYRTCNPINYIETALLRDADFLDFLGTIGIAREFARGSKALKKCCEQVIARRDGVINKLTLPKAKGIAEIRVLKMNNIRPFSLRHLTISKSVESSKVIQIPPSVRKYHLEKNFQRLPIHR